MRQALDPQGGVVGMSHPKPKKLAGIRMALSFVLSRQAPSGDGARLRIRSNRPARRKGIEGIEGIGGAICPRSFATPLCPLCPPMHPMPMAAAPSLDGPSGSDGAVSAKPSVAGDVEVADSSAPPTLEKSETVGWAMAECIRALKAASPPASRRC